MPLGMHDMDGWFGPSTNQKREIGEYVTRAWDKWRTGLNLEDVLPSLVAEAAKKQGGMYMDYFPPEPGWVSDAIKKAFTEASRPNSPLCALLASGPTDHLTLALDDILSVMERVPEFESQSLRGGTMLPQLVISQDWPQLLAERTLRRGNDEKVEWDIEGRLGDYDPQNVRIRLYSRAIRRCSHELGCAPQEVLMIVYLHELAHFATHLYPDREGSTWSTVGFTSADSAILECLAQWLALEATRSGKTQLARVFDALNDRQSAKYRSHKDLAGQTPSTILASLPGLRLADPCPSYREYVHPLAQRQAGREYDVEGRQETTHE